MRIATSILLVGVMISGTANAVIPLQVNYQGRVTVGGRLFDGNGLFRFTLADRKTSVTLWCNDGSQVGQSAANVPLAAVNLPVINGIFNVRLGDTSLPRMAALPSAVFDSDRVVLRVWFDDQIPGHGNRLLLPDQPVVSVAYAFHALKADSATTATFASNASRLNGLPWMSWQQRVTGAAGPNQFIRAINPDGSILTGTTATVALSAVRAKAADLATTASFARAATTATVALLARNSDTLDFRHATDFITGVLAGEGLAGGGTSGNVILSVLFAGSGVSTAVARADHGHPPGTGWSLTGNAGTTPASNFLGTLDDVPLEVRVNGGRALIIEPTTGTANLVGGHPENTVADRAQGAFIGGGGETGGLYNLVSDNFGAIGGGKNNMAGNWDGDPDNARFATVGGGEGNFAVGYYSAIGGGAANTTLAGHATIGGGDGNTAGDVRATVAGGQWNEARGPASTVGGGVLNQATSESATVGGGESNFATALKSTVSGGGVNAAGGMASAIGGGMNNVAGGYAATVPGGNSNAAAGDYSFAAGLMARAGHTGTFVWASNGSTPFDSTGDQQFLIDALGGVGINTTSPSGYALRVAGSVGFEGSLDMHAGETPAEIINLAEPTAPQSAATKNYVDSRVAAFLLPNYITGCELEWVDTDTIRVAPGSIELAGTLLTNGTFSPNIDAGNPDLWLNGSEAADMWIYVYLGANSLQWEPKFSDQPPNCNDTSSHTAGTLRYRHYDGNWYRCIGAVRNDGGGNAVRFHQIGNWLHYVTGNNVKNNGASTSFQDVDCSSYVPRFSQSALLTWQAGPANATSFVFRIKGETSNYMTLSSDDSNFSRRLPSFLMPLNSSQVFEYLSDDPIYPYGIIDVVGFDVGSLR